MDSYSGSEPRTFISFHLGEEKIGQPTQSLTDIEMTSDPVDEVDRDTHEFMAIVQPSEQTEAMDHESPLPSYNPLLASLSFQSSSPMTVVDLMKVAAYTLRVKRASWRRQPHKSLLRSRK